jgi:hypothetical protein
MLTRTAWNPSSVDPEGGDRRSARTRVDITGRFGCACTHSHYGKEYPVRGKEWG